MLFAGITCNVYENIELELELSMTKQLPSNGKPSWVDYGAGYDISAITVTITAEGVDRASLEAVLRTQNLSPSTSVTFDDGEWLYAFTHEYTIQEYKLIDAPRRWAEYGFEVVLAPITPIDFIAMDSGSGTVPPTITVQPTSQTVSAGDTATFGPIAYSGSASTIQWYKDSVLLTGETALTLERENTGLSYFEAPPFAGSVGSPVTTDPNWALVSGGSGNGVEYEGDYATALDSNNQNNLYRCVHTGTVKDYTSDCTGSGNFSTTPWLKGAISASNNTWVQCQWIGGSAYASAYVNGTEKGLTVISVGQSATVDSRVFVEISVDGTTPTITTKFYDPSGTMITSDTSTYADGYDPTQDYSGEIFSYNNDVRYDLIRIEGEGFPNELGDPFGTEYTVTVTNTAGSDTSDTVTTLEAI